MRNAAGCFSAPLMAASCSCAVQGLFFGDFLLAPQKKVTPPPGGTPGNAPGSRILRKSNHTKPTHPPSQSTAQTTHQRQHARRQ
jgi:hypothetical protein